MEEEIINYHEAYEKKRAEMKKEYEFAVNAISRANDVPVDDAFNMLEANVIYGGNYPYVNAEAFTKDYEELKGYSDHNAEEAGLDTEELN